LKEYKDEDGNIYFNNYLLEEQIKDIKTEQLLTPATGISEEALQQILEEVTKKNEQKSKVHNLRKISEKLVIEKFTGKNASAQQWMEIFESECSRLEINQDTNKIELLRLFLEGYCMDWYSSMLIKYTLDSSWEKWKKIFCDTYADKGWTPLRYAIEYKYMKGSLLEYALKKERILLEINKSLEKQILIDLIAVGLPSYICDRINRKSLEETEDLFNEIRGLEHLVKKTFDKKEKTYLEKKSKIK